MPGSDAGVVITVATRFPVIGVTKRSKYRGLEIFSGNGGLSKALAAEGWGMHSHDLLNDGGINILQNGWLPKYCNAILAGLFAFVHLGTECRSFSRAAYPAVDGAHKRGGTNSNVGTGKRRKSTVGTVQLIDTDVVVSDF